MQGPSTDLKDISLDASGDQPLSNAAQDPMGGGAADAATGSSGADGVAAANAAPSHFAEQSETTASASAMAFRRPSHEAGPSARGSLDGMRADVYALQQGQPSYTNIEVRPSDTHGARLCCQLRVQRAPHARPPALSTTRSCVHASDSWNRT